MTTLTAPSQSQAIDQPHAEQVAMRQIDGVVCFGGEDWWYHNQGHYDMQMMRHFSRRVPVLYVNSIGMRLPSLTEGGMFVRRIYRKLRSIRRGFVRQSESLGVLSPLTAPGWLDNAITRGIAIRQIRSAMTSMGITQPLVWAACPRAAQLCDSLRPAGFIYQRTDRYEAFPRVDSDLIRRCDRVLKQRADLTVFCAQHLMQLEYSQCRSAVVVEHGVDYHHFTNASSRCPEPAESSNSPEPADMSRLPHPRVGFIGSVDNHTFDADLFLAVARELSHVHFVIVGGCSLAEQWCTLSNVTQLGRKPYRDIPAYMAACDVLIMPWRRNDWIEACHPVKLKEYLAVGRPIVSTSFAELKRYEAFVSIAHTPQHFAGEIRNALQTAHDAQPGRELVRPFAWHRQAELLQHKLEEIGIKLVMRAAAASDSPTPASSEIDLKWPAQRAHPHVDSAWLQETGLTKSTTAPVTASLSLAPPAEGRLAACILLAGSLRPSPLIEATGCSVLDLMLTSNQSVLEHWLERFQSLAESERELLRVRVIHDANTFCPWPNQHHSNIVTLEREPKSHRGSAGLLRDVCAAYDSSDHVIVAEASRYAPQQLIDLHAAHLRRGSDVTIGCNPDGSPAGLFVIRCGALATVSPIGFVDLKEQWINDAKGNGLRIDRFEFPAPGTISLRTRTDLLHASALASGAMLSEHAAVPFCGSLRHRGQRGLRVICHGALIGPNASIVDSIIMPHAVVSRNAVIVRSVVGPHGYIRPGEIIVNAIVPGGSRATNSRIRCA